MAETKGGSYTPITLALIGTGSVIVAALISSWFYRHQPDQHHPDSARSAAISSNAKPGASPSARP